MSSTNETVALSPAPVDPRRRIEAIDMVRGFALFGVLLVNLYNFGAYSIVWNEPGDEIAFIPTGVPGPHRLMLGIHEAGKGHLHD